MANGRLYQSLRVKIMAIKVIPTEKLTHKEEHSVQVQLINLLTKALTEQRDDEEVIEILDQILKFSEVHFMSEQLIMRQHSYDGFDEHENEHRELVDQLQKVKQKLLSDETRLTREDFDRVRSAMLNHIATQDQKLADFLSVQR